MSRNGKEYPRAPPPDTDTLLECELVWSRLPGTMYHGIISCLSVGGCLSLDSAMTDRERRPHLMKAYEGLVSAAFNGYQYSDEGDYAALRWVMKRGIDLRGFTVKVRGTRQSGPVLVMLMGYGPKGDLGIARYYAMRGKLEDVDEGHVGYTALTRASSEGYKDIVEALLAAGADTEKADEDGYTALMRAAIKGHIEVAEALLAAGADTEKATRLGYTALIWAAREGHIKVVKALLAAGADTEKADRQGYTALVWAVDRVLDMCRTATNIWSDACGAYVVAHSENALEEAQA